MESRKTRRIFLAQFGLLGIAFASVWGCGGGSDGDSSEEIRRGVTVISGGDPLGTMPATRARFSTRAEGDSIFALLGILGILGGNALVYGFRDSAGLPAGVAQTVYWEENITDGIRLLYDATGLPVQLFFLATGAFLTLVWDTVSGRCYVRSFTALGELLGGFVLSIVNGVVTAIAELTDDAPLTSVTGTPAASPGNIPAMPALAAQQFGFAPYVQAVGNFFAGGAGLLGAQQLNNLRLFATAITIGGRALLFLLAALQRVNGGQQNIGGGNAAAGGGQKGVFNLLGIGRLLGLLLLHFFPFRPVIGGRFFELIGVTPTPTPDPTPTPETKDPRQAL